MGSQGMKGGIIAVVLMAVPAGVTQAVRWMRQKGQKGIQDEVNRSAPKINVRAEKNLDECDYSLEVVDKDALLMIDSLKEVTMNDTELDKWKSLLSFLGGETLKTGLNTQAFTGLLKCDIPLNELFKLKDNPEVMRGFVIKDGKFSKHASFQEVGLKNAAPLLIYQCLAAVTSQYYQHIVTERLNQIESKLNEIIDLIIDKDKAELAVAYNRFLELSGKDTFDITDKMNVDTLSHFVLRIRDDYRQKLEKISNLDIDYCMTDYKEAKKKIAKLNESKYLTYLTMALNAELFSYIASILSIKIALYLGNDEDAMIYLKRINMKNWDDYEANFLLFRHDVLKYLELEEHSSLFETKKIARLRKECENQFDKVGDVMEKICDQFKYRTTQYLKVDADGTIKKYISVQS